jgi:NAD(P)H dehydrogenase (quinone)
MYVVGLPFTAEAMNRTRTGGSPYGATHFAAGDAPDAPVLSDHEKELARLLGRRVAELAIAVAGRRP